MPNPDYRSIVEVLDQHSRENCNQTAFAFEHDSGVREAWTYRQLAERSRTLAAWLLEQTSPGERAVLVYPPGLEFIAAFMGCLYAGVLPVPATYPKPRRPMPRLDSIVADCSPALVLTQSSVIAGLSLDEQSPAISQLVWEATDQISTSASYSFRSAEHSLDSLAFLQYTSGSTSEPRGVMVSHRNVLHNVQAIRRSFDIADDERPQAVFWLPAYHDMGLIGGILTPLYVGGTSTLIAPTTFLRRPQRWLELMSSTGAAISGAPNFGYELAARKTTALEREGLDLRRWRLAFCGAEPINPTTLDEFAETFAASGFRRSSFFPCYGLAESTLLVTGGQSSAGPRVLQVDRAAIREHKVRCTSGPAFESRPIVSCGRECAGLQLEIVNPFTQNFCGTNDVGEVWIRGDSIAQGYWNKNEESDSHFRAKIAANGAIYDGEYLRTGDLGFRYDGELFITGRLKDVIIVRGRNHYPQDLERTAQAAHHAVDTGAAFSIEVDGHEELILVHQVRRECRTSDPYEIVHAVRNAVVAEHEIDPHAIVLIRPAALPVTSSGKVQRQRCREMYAKGELSVLREWINPQCAMAELDGNDEQLINPPAFLKRVAILSRRELQENIERWLIEWLTARAQLAPGSLLSETSFAQLGIDSLTAVEISQELDHMLGLESPPMAIWTYSTIATLADYLAEELHSHVPQGVK